MNQRMKRWAGIGKVTDTTQFGISVPRKFLDSLAGNVQATTTSLSSITSYCTSEARYDTPAHTVIASARIIIMGLTVDALEFIKLEPAEVYQEAALNLRYKRITAITAPKLQQAMNLLQLEPYHLVMRGLASGRSLVKGLDLSDKRQRGQNHLLVAANFWNFVTTKAFSPQNDYIQDDQDDGWGNYEDNYDSDSDIDDDEDQDGEIELQRKGPIYAFLVYGGVQLRPDEYILLFRALGVSPEYVEQVQYSNSETVEELYKALHSHGSSSRSRDELGISFSKIYPSQGCTSLSSELYCSNCRHMSHRYTPNIFHRYSARSHVSTACSPETSKHLL